MRLVILLTFIASLAWARPEVLFKTSVAVSPRTSLTLADIVEVNEPSEALLQILTAMPVANEKKENIISLSGQEIAKIIKNEMMINQSLRELNPAFKIPEKIEIKKSTSAVSREEMSRKILNQARTRCETCFYQVLLQNVPTLNTADWSVDLANLPMKGSFILPVRGQDVTSSQWVTGQIKVSKSVPVLTRYMAMGERVTKKDVTMLLKDITLVRDNTLTLEDIDGQTTARPMSAGAVLMASDLKREPAAKKGQVVKVISGDTTFEVSINAVAEDSGFVGDLIKVKTIDNQKLLSGTVIERGVVKLQ